MKILIQDLIVIFPYPLVFNQQIEYMTSLKRTLDGQGHGLLQMPTGTGKTVCLLSLLIAYITQRKNFKKIIYCTRTVVEMDKTLNQLKKLLKKIQEENPESPKLVATGLTAKKNLCIHKHVDVWKSNGKVEEECRKRTSQWNRNLRKGKDGKQQKNQPKEQNTFPLNTFPFPTTSDPIEQSQHLCQMFQNQRENPAKLALQDTNAVYTMPDLRSYGTQHIKCPYYVAKDTLESADIIVFNYLYLIDHQISGGIIKKMAKDSIVVFDEAHNIDDICIEAYSVRINRRTISSSQQSLKYLKSKISSVEQTNVNSFKQACMTLIEKMNKDKPEENKITSIPIDRKRILPSTILNSEDYLYCMESIVVFLKGKLAEKNVAFYDPSYLITELRYQNLNIDEDFLVLSSEKLRNLMVCLEISEMSYFESLNRITVAMSYLATYSKGFRCIFQPNTLTENLIEPTLTLACTDASIAMKPIFSTFKSVILTSGTISPIELYPKLLNFQPIVLKSIDIELTRNSIQPMIISNTIDNTPISSQYISRDNKAVTRNFANLILSLSDTVPDGILCFFPSYKYLQHVVKEWSEDKLLDQILLRRYVFIQNKDPIEANNQLVNYRKACDIGRGAVFLAIARGKIAEGIDFQQQYGRCVVMIGFPVQNSHQLVLLQRIKYMVKQKQIKDKNEFLEFDTMRQCAQCLGRVMRKKTDYGLMILADHRFSAPGKYNKLPMWIRKALSKDMIDLTMETVSLYAGKFFRSMGEKFILNERLFKREEYFRERVEVQEVENWKVRVREEKERKENLYHEMEKEKKEERERKREKERERERAREREEEEEEDYYR